MQQISKLSYKNSNRPSFIKPYSNKLQCSSRSNKDRRIVMMSISTEQKPSNSWSSKRRVGLARPTTSPPSILLQGKVACRPHITLFPRQMLLACKWRADNRLLSTTFALNTQGEAQLQTVCIGGN